MRRHRHSARRHRHSRGVPGDIGDCGVGITLQMCNRVTNHGGMGTFSKPGAVEGLGTTQLVVVKFVQEGESQDVNAV